MVNIISSILIWTAAAILLLRVLYKSGLQFNTKSPLVSGILKDTASGGSFCAGKKETLTVFGVSFIFRIIVLVISVFAIFIVKDSEFSLSEFLNSYLQWDANNYYRIAKGGYSYHTENGMFTTLAFFPLYPWLVRVVGILTGNLVVSGVLTSCLLYSGACAYMYKLLSYDYEKQTAIRAIVYISVFPHSLFFGTMMNESMLFFTMAATLYYIRRHDWVRTGIFGALAALSRMVGILLAVPAAVEWLEHYRIIEKLKNKSYKEICSLFFKKGIWIFLMLLGTGIYLFCNYKTTGEWFKFLEYQKEIWHNGAVYFGKGISLITDNAIANNEFTKFALWLPELISVVFVIVMLIYGLRSTQSMYTVFLLVYIIINTGFEWPISIARYMCCALPAFVILSDFSQKHKWTEPVITASMAIAMGVFLTAYFMSRQIL